MLKLLPLLDDSRLSMKLTQAYGSLADDLLALALNENPEDPRKYVMELVLGYDEQLEDCNRDDLWHVCWKFLNGHTFAHVCLMAGVLRA